MRGTGLGLCALSLGAVLAAQQQPPQTFRGGVELVVLNVTVVDKDGKPVRGLTASDFTVTLDGQARPVRALDFLEFGASGGSDGTAVRQTTNERVPGAPANRGGRVIVLLIDDLSSKPGQAKGLVVAAERMLGRLDSGDLVGLTTTSGQGPAVTPTRDRSALLTALKSKRIVGKYDDTPVEFYISVNEALDIDRGFPQSTLGEVVARECFEQDPKDELCPIRLERAARTLARATIHRAAMQLTSYETVIRALVAAPEPRIIVALSSGLAPGADGDTRQALEPVSRAAAEAGVQFYALTEEPDDIDMRDTSDKRAKARREEGAFLTAGMQTVASAAGGEAFKVVGQADRFLTRILSETSGIYRLGVEAPLLRDKRRYVSPKVTLSKPGLTVRVHRDALVASAAAPDLPIDDRLRSRLAQGGVAFGVPIAVGTSVRREEDGPRLQLAVNVEVPSIADAPLVAMFSIVNAAGQTVQMGRKELPPAAPGEDYRLALPLPVLPGRYQLRLAVADGKGNLGSVEHQVNAGLPQVGRFQVSDLFTSWVGLDGRSRFLALEMLPATAETLRATLELYQRDKDLSGTDLTVLIEVVPAGTSRPVLERDVVPAREGSALVASAEFPIGHLDAGPYTIRATIRETGTTIGTVTAVVRKR